MTSIMDDNAQVGVFIGLTAVIWGDWFAPTVSIWADYQLFKLWREKWKKRFWLPPMFVFALLIVIMYGFMQASLYAFYRNVFSTTNPAWVPTAVTLLFLFFLMFTKRWLAVYMIGGRNFYAMFLLLLALATSVPVMALFGIYNHFLELYCLIPYMLFWLGAFYLNARSLWVEQHDPAFCSEISKEKWYADTAKYDPLSGATPEMHSKIAM
jgi:hypothetical protein